MPARPHPALVAAAIGALALFGAGVLWAIEPFSDRGPPVIREGALLTVDREALAEIDLGVVHEELIPEWVVSSGPMQRMHFSRIRRAVGRDRNLGALLDRMELLFEADPVLNATELLGLVRTWNAYLDKAGEPWRLAGEVRVGDGGGQLLLKSYRVIFEGSVQTDEASFDAEIRRRVDRTTLVDAWLGRMHDHTDGMVVLLDQVTAFSLDQIWPMIDPALAGDLDPLAAAFAPAIREEVAAWMSPEEVDALVATASDRFWMNRAADAIHGRHQCGSAFYVARVPWNGMSPRDLATLQQNAARGAGQACPDVTETEALVFAVRSGHLRRTPDVHPALEHLVGLMANAVVVHEARHAADDLALDGQPIACIGCPEGTSHTAALEGSAYAASFAHPSHGALSMYQACALDAEWVPDRAAMVEFLAQRMHGTDEGGCAAGPPPDLAARARALQREIFDNEAPIVVSDFPSSLPVSAAYTSP